MSNTVTQAAEVAAFIARELASAGDAVTLPKLQCLAYHCQGWALAILGTPAFSEALQRGQDGPLAASVKAAYWQQRDQVKVDLALPAPTLPPALQDVVQAVLRHYSGQSGWQLRDGITAQSLWDHSVKTEGRIDPANQKAYYQALPRLELAPAADPVQVAFPVLNYSHQAVDHDEVRETRRRHVEQKEREREDCNARLREAFAPAGSVVVQ